MSEENTYWNSNGRYQKFADLLTVKMPRMGEVADAKNNPALDRFRRASNCYYDLYNNGLGNRAREFARVFKFATTQYKYRGKYGMEFSSTMYRLTELVMDQIIIDAVEEQLK